MLHIGKRTAATTKPLGTVALSIHIIYPIFVFLFCFYFYSRMYVNVLRVEFGGFFFYFIFYEFRNAAEVKMQIK